MTSARRMLLVIVVAVGLCASPILGHTAGVTRLRDVTPVQTPSASPPPATASAPSATIAPQPTPTPQPAERDAPDLNKGVWVRGPNLPSARQDAAAAVLAGRIYLIGGFGPHDQQMDSTLVWEPQVAPGAPHGEAERAGARLGVWTYAARIPEPVDNAAAAVVGGYIYVAGGRIENLVTNKFWRYDAGNDSWTQMPSLPIPRFGPTMQAVGDKLYVIGGAVSHGSDATSMMVYDIPTGQWSIREYATSYARIAPRSALIGGTIVLLGGRDDYDRNLPFCDLYYPATDRWQTCDDLRQPRSDFGLSLVDNRLVAVGGDDLHASGPTQTMEISEPNLNGWLSGPWMPSPRHGMAQVTLGNVVWVMGGSSTTGTAPTASVLRYISPLVKVKLKKGQS
jgi:Kelch motif protein